MVTGLFRSQVLQRQADRLQGDILLLPRLSHTVILLSLLLWLSAVVVWLTTSQYTRKATVPGWIEPSGGIVRLYGVSSGLVERVLVEEGEWVTEGQSLVIVDAGRILEGGSPLGNLLADEYEEQRALLHARLDRGERIFAERQRWLDKRLNSLKKRLALLQEQQLIQRESFAIAVEQVGRLRKLRKNGHASSAELEAARARELELRERGKAISSSRLELQEQIQDLTTESALFPEEYANSRSELHARLSGISQKITQLQGQESYVIRASRSGMVSNLQVREGQRLDPGKPALALVPEHRQMTAQLLVPVRAAGFLDSGLPLNIRYDAFPYQKFGIYHGGINKISSSVLLPEELLNAPVSVREPVFRVTAELDHAAVHAYGRDFPLKPGMTLAADIRLSERSLLQWLMEPLFSLKGRL